jgi:hypothetical protein
VTDAVSEEVKAWQARPLNALYPILYLDCIHVKVRDAGAVRNKAVFLATQPGNPLDQLDVPLLLKHLSTTHLPTLTRQSAEPCTSL